MKPRHKITDEYNKNPRHVRRWDLTIEWLKTFQEDNHIPYHPAYIVKGICLDCGDPSEMTSLLFKTFPIGLTNTRHDLNYKSNDKIDFAFENIFAFEIIEHLLNPLVFMEWIKSVLIEDGSVFLSTPIFRPKWMRNKKWHFHEFNRNELMYLIDKAGFNVINKKIVNPQRWYYLFTGLRPFLRFLGFDRTILLRLERK